MPRAREVPHPVLVIEDSPPMRTALLELFADLAGLHVVAEATTELNAMEWLHGEESSWSLAVVDLMLETGSGFNLLPRLRAHHRAGRIIVLSDFVTDAVAKRCVQLGADAVFSKSKVKEFLECIECFAAAGDGVGSDCFKNYDAQAGC
jgi:two-component system, OmpR family, response regulator